MSQFTWSGLDDKAADAIAASRLMQGASTLLGATFPTDVAQVAALAELVASKNTYTDTEIVTLLNQVRNIRSYQIYGNPGLAISTNFDIKNANAISYSNGGIFKTLSANTNFDTGTAATVGAAKWLVFVCWVNSSGTAGTTAFTNAGVGYSSEALAIAAITDPDSTYTIIGYATVLSGAATWLAGTDALTTGTGGTVATSTTYYNASNPNSIRVGSAVS